MFGTRSGGLISYDELTTVNYIRGDLGCGFGGCDEACYLITSFDLIAIKDDLIYSEKIIGHTITEKSKRILSQFQDGGFIYLTNIEAKWCGKHKIVDTTIQFKPIILKVKGENLTEDIYLLKGFAKNISEEYRFVHVLSLKNPDFEFPFLQDKKVRIWTIVKAIDNSLISELNYSNNTLQEMKTFFPDNTVKIAATYNYKNSTCTFIKNYNNGKIESKGKLLILANQTVTFEILTLISEEKQLSNEDFPILIGEWSSYYSTGKLKESGNYDTTSIIESFTIINPDTPDDPYNTIEKEFPIKTSVRNGLWKFYDEKGKLIRQTFYEKGHIKE